MFTHVSALFRRIRNRLSLSEWIVRRLNLPLAVPDAPGPGLILIQIDSLSYNHLVHAMDKGWMPFLKQLLTRERYSLQHFYSGVPSSTPSVQGELFYGVRQAVPAFEYMDHCGRIFVLHNPHAAEEIEKRLARESEGLLSSGSSYGNIFSGGARESHFCLAALDSQSYWKTFLPYGWMFAVIFNPVSILHALFSTVFDIGMLITEVIRKIRGWKELIEELKGIPVRIFVTIFLRHFITMGCRVDIARSFPVICGNFFGYDEIAHRFGTRSFFARMALGQIDRSIHKIFKSANRSISRDYEVWIYADHGQEDTAPFRAIHGESLKKRVFRVLPEKIKELGAKDITITAQGPLGFVYMKKSLTGEETETAARALVEAGVPLVLAAEGEKAVCWNDSGKHALPEDAEKVLGADHPFLEDAARELAGLCRRQDTGSFIISGWRLGEKPVSFPVEWASHGGPGPNETDGFVLFPFNTPVELVTQAKYLRPADLRQGVIDYMKGEKYSDLKRAFLSRGLERPLRVMSYNVHSCIGMDRRLSPERIARVISRHAPDVVALQELDRRRSRSMRADQAHEIANLLGMTYHFFPTIAIEEEEYGDAVLCRHPMRLIRAGELAGFKNIPDLEPRGALWVEIDFFGKKVQLVNTHFSLLGAERALETDDLLGKGWMGSPECRSPLIFCGDLNMLPHEKPNRRFRSRFQDVSVKLPAYRRAATYPSFKPLVRLDYIYVSKDIEIALVDVPKMGLERVASDHFPVIADLVLP